MAGRLGRYARAAMESIIPRVTSALLEKQSKLNRSQGGTEMDEQVH